MSLLELLNFLEKFFGKQIPLCVTLTGGPGTSRSLYAIFQRQKKPLTGRRKSAPEDGVKKLYDWVKDNQELFKGL